MRMEKGREPSPEDLKGMKEEIVLYHKLRKRVAELESQGVQQSASVRAEMYDEESGEESSSDEEGEGVHGTRARMCCGVG